MSAWTVDDNGLPIYLDDAGNPVNPGDEAFRPGPAASVDYSGGADAVSGPSGTAPAVVDTPSGATIPEGQQGGSWSYGQSTGDAGFDPARYAQVMRTGGALQKAYAGEDRTAADAYGRDATGVNDTIAAQKDATALPSEVAGAPSDLALQTQIAATKAEQASRYVALNKHLMEVEATGQAAADRVVATSQQNYEKEVMTYRAMSVQPGRLWKNMGSGGRVQALTAVFVNDFLGARGIKTSALDSLNRAIDQDIDAQSQNIAKEGRVVDMFGNLWNQAIAQSATQAEARERMRGFYLEDFKAGVAQELSQYDAPMAQVAAVKAINQLEAGRQDSLLKLRSYWQERADVAKGRDLEEYKAHLQASMASAQNASQERIAAMETGAKMAAAQGKQPDPLSGIMFNPETGDPEAKFLPDITDADKEAQRTSYAGYLGFVRKIKAFKDVQAKYGKLYDGPGGKFLRSSEGQAVYADWVSMINDYVYSTTGKQVNENEFNRAANLLPLETLLTRSDNSGILNDRINEAYAKQNAITQSTTVDFTDEERAALGGVHGHSAEAGGGVVAETRVTPPVTTPVADIMKRAASPGSQDTASDTGSELGSQAKQLWQASGANNFIDVQGTTRAEENPRQWAVDMVEATNEALRAYNGATDSTEKDSVRSEMVSSLKAYTDPDNAVYTQGGKKALSTKDTAEYQQKNLFAKYLIKEFMYEVYGD